VIELAPGVDLDRDVLAQAGFALQVADDLRPMDPRLFRPEPMRLVLPENARWASLNRAVARMNGPHAHVARCPPGGQSAPFGRPGGR
jgi:hypothetical protein